MIPIVILFQSDLSESLALTLLLSMKESPSLNAYVKWSLCLSACSDSWFYFLFDTRNHLQISIRETKNIQLICVIHHEHITSLKVWGFGWMVEHTFSWIGRTNLNESFLLNVLLSLDLFSTGNTMRRFVFETNHVLHVFGWDVCESSLFSHLCEVFIDCSYSEKIC